MFNVGDIVEYSGVIGNPIFIVVKDQMPHQNLKLIRLSQNTGIYEMLHRNDDTVFFYLTPHSFFKNKIGEVDGEFKIFLRGFGF